MRTLDAQKAQSFSPGARAARDIKLLLRLAVMLTSYFTKGALIRREYRKRERRGEIYYLEDEPR